MIQLFATQFPLGRKRAINLENILGSMYQWIELSPHNHFSHEELSSLSQSNQSIEKNRSSVHFSSSEDGKDQAGIRYIHPGKWTNDSWVTEVVAGKINDQYWVSIVTGIETPKKLMNLPIIKKTRLISQLLEKFGGGIDGSFFVQGIPHRIKDDTYANLMWASSAITNQCNNELPIVYVSCITDDVTVVNSSRLSKSLEGMAHVIVEPFRNFSFKMQEQSGGRNTYKGGVGIYWPHTFGFQRILPTDAKYALSQNSPSALGGLAEKMEEEVYLEVLQGMRNQQIHPELSWNSLLTRNTRLMIEKIRESTAESKDMNDILSLYDEESKAQKRRISEQQERIIYLTGEIARMNDRNKQHGGEILRDPQISEMYGGEVMDVLIDMLRDSRNRLPSNERTRRQEIIDSVLKVNKESGMRTEFLESLKHEFESSYREMTPGLKKRLQEMGFRIYEERRHVRIEHPATGICHTYQKTGGDVRSGKNNFSEFKRSYF